MISKSVRNQFEMISNWFALIEIDKGYLGETERVPNIFRWNKKFDQKIMKMSEKVAAFRVLQWTVLLDFGCFWILCVTEPFCWTVWLNREHCDYWSKKLDAQLRHVVRTGKCMAEGSSLNLSLRFRVVVVIKRALDKNLWNITTFAVVGWNWLESWSFQLEDFKPKLLA